MSLGMVGLIVAFALILFLNSKKINLDMGLSIIIGGIVVGFFSLHLSEIFDSILTALIDPLTIKLFIIINLISGLGYMLEETGDFEMMIQSLVKILPGKKIITMVLPALIGTLSIPGGAILSAPMIDESGDKINLTAAKKTAVNLFFRHIFLFVYPLVSSIILTSELFEVDKFFVIKNNLLIMIAGVITAYFTFFNKDNKIKATKKEDGKVDYKKETLNFIKSFSAILLIIILALIFKVPFYISVIAGVLFGIGRNLKFKKFFREYKIRTVLFFKKGIKYKMGFLFVGIMIFKSIVKKSGAVNEVSEILSSGDLPLYLLIVFMGLVVGYLTGMTSAGLGILIPIFQPLIPSNLLGSYIALIFTTVFMGYLISPLHLCFALTKEYFNSTYKRVYKLMAPPIIVMIITSVIMVLI